MSAEAGNTTLNFVRIILMQLCSNYDETAVTGGGWQCRMRPDYHFRLKELKGKTLKFATLQKLPLSGIVEDEDGNYHGTGVVFDIMHEIQEQLGFNYTLTRPKSNNIGGESDGIVQMLKDKEVDMAVAFIPIMNAYQDIISYSAALTDFEWVLFMARPVASANGSGLLAPFQEEVWVLILISLIIAGPTMYLITYLTIKFAGKEHTDAKPYSLNSCVWFAYGALMKQGSSMNPQQDSPRLFFASWWIFITILTAFYTANLTAFLTLSHFTLTIQTTEDIYRNKRHWMADQNGMEEPLIMLEDSFDYLKETIPKYGRFTTESLEVRLEKVLKGEIYISEKRKADKILMLDYLNKSRAMLPEKKRCTFVATTNSILAKPVGFAYQKDSYLKPLFDPLLMQFVSGGIVTHLLQSHLPASKICPLNLADRERKLLNADLITTYEAVFIGFGTALIAFIGEISYRIYKKGGQLQEQDSEHGDGHPPGKRTFKSEVKKISNIIFVTERSKPPPSDNFFIHDYYKEINPISYRESQNLARENNSRLILPEKMKRKKFLYQFIN